MVFGELNEYLLQFPTKIALWVMAFILSCVLHIQKNQQPLTVICIRHLTTTKFCSLNYSYDSLKYNNISPYPSPTDT
jgi:hypothetical protein